MRRQSQVFGRGFGRSIRNPHQTVDLCEVLDLVDKPVHEAEAVWQALDA